MGGCRVFKTTNLMGKKWTIFLLQEISLHGDRGFNFLLSNMKKLTPKVLSSRLKDLGINGIIQKDVVSYNNLIRTTYKLTQKGEELFEILNELKRWNMRHNEPTRICDKKECIECELY